MHTHWSTLSDTIAEVEAVTIADTRDDAHALVDTLGDTLAEVETLGDTRDDSHALFDTLAYTLAEVRAQGDTRRCACTARHWLHGSRGGGGDTTRRKGRCARTGRHSF